MPVTVPFPRELRIGASGSDVVAIKRALSRFGVWPWASFSEDYTKTFADRGVKRFQRDAGLKVDGIYGLVTHNSLRTKRLKGSKTEWAFDKTAINLMKEADDKPLAKVRELLAFCRKFDHGYVYGGEHDASFLDDNPHLGYDCSSSTSYALWKVGLLGVNQAQVSSWFESWGKNGRGKYLTIHCNSDHVWMEFSLPEGYFRFDTSPQGQGAQGPRVRTLQRSNYGFVHRHPYGY